MIPHFRLSNSRRAVRRPDGQRILHVESLESRLLMSGTPLGEFAIDDSPVAWAPSSTLPVIFKPLPQNMFVNTRDVDLALAAGMHHLQNILDADNNDIPFFYVYALTKPQAQVYGDTVGFDRQHPAHMAFERRLTSNVAGRALYAVLSAADATGEAVDAEAVDALTTTVLWSLHKPRNGNWADTSPSNQMFSGLASDPRSYGSTQFDLTLLYNMGAGMRGALGLATLADEPEAVLPGYPTSAKELFESAVDNVRRYYVYGGGPIGGTRTYNWETFRNAFALEGGNRSTGTVQGDIMPDWTGIWQGWSDPFYVYALVKYYEATGHQPTLELAKELRDYAFYSRFPLDPQSVPFHQFGHMFEVVGAMNAFSRLALATGDADMMERVRVRYEALRGIGFNTTGWVPENFGIGSDVGEINNTGELIETALTFAEWGWTEYYADVERFTRGHLLPAQLLDTSFIAPNSAPQNDGQRDPGGRMYGAFGFPAPYGPVPTLKPSHLGGYFADITAGGVATLVEIKRATYKNEAGTHHINLLFDIDNSDISFVSPYAGQGQATVTPKSPGSIRLQLPDWVDRDALSASLAAQELQFDLLPDAVLIHEPVVGQAISLVMPLRTEWTVDVVNGRQLTIQWRGDELVSMSRMNTPMAFFSDRSAWRNGAETGDFQQDGDVDGGDFLAWQRAFGLAEPGADATGDDIVDGLDLEVWVANFGGEAIAVANVANSTLGERSVNNATVAASVLMTDGEISAANTPQRGSSNGKVVHAKQHAVALWRTDETFRSRPRAAAMSAPSAAASIDNDFASWRHRQDSAPVAALDDAFAGLASSSRRLLDR